MVDKTYLTIPERYFGQPWVINFTDGSNPIEIDFYKHTIEIRPSKQERSDDAVNGYVLPMVVYGITDFGIYTIPLRLHTTMDEFNDFLGEIGVKLIERDSYFKMFSEVVLS